MIDALLLHALVWLLLPLLHPSADGAAASPPARFAVDLLDPAPVAVPGKAVVDYRVRAIAGISSADGVARPVPRRAAPADGAPPLAVRC